MNAVRARDGRCMVSGRQLPNWRGLEAAHIFPLAQGALWTQNHCGRWITDGSESIDSVQNGILLAATEHLDFDAFAFSINPDVW